MWKYIVVLLTIFVTGLFVILVMDDKNPNIVTVEDDKSQMCNSISSMSLEGTWIFTPTDSTLVNGELILASNNSFILTGWSSNDFKSIGRWKYNSVNSILTLEFTDNEEYWQKWLVVDDIDNFDSIIDINSLEVDIKIDHTPADSISECYAYVDFFGWLFRHKITK